MKKKFLVTRRQALITGIGTLGGFLLTGCGRKLPPSYGSILRMGDAFTYGAQRTLLPGQSLAREYDPRDISSFPATGTTNPATDPQAENGETYARLLANDFRDWRLSVEGMVNHPTSYSLAELQRLPSQKQITRHTCEEGWTAIAEWTGVPLGIILQAAGIKPEARFVAFKAYDGWVDCIDMLDAFHPQTILAYGMNGKNLPIPHGAPIRLRVEKQIGYKSMKYIEKIFLTDEFTDKEDIGWAWYVGM